MKEPVEVLEHRRPITDEEMEELDKVSERKSLRFNSYDVKDADLSFIRQHNFTICVLHSNVKKTDGFQAGIVSVSKKHPEYDPQYNPEVGKKLALIRAFENLHMINS